MDKLEAIKKEYGPEIELDESFNPPRFEVDGKVYSIRDDDELEADAKENAKEIFDESSDEANSDWVKKWGGISEFYDEVWVNDFRIEDSETFGDLSDEEILDKLENEYCYFENGYPRAALDFDKMADFVYDYDGAVGLSRYDGNIKYVYGFHVIRED